jgi:hypothetical protein
MGSSTQRALSPYHPAYRKDSHGSGEEAAARIRMTREQQFLSELAVIERVIAAACARRGLRGGDAEDFASVVKTRFVENDYEILSKFQGRTLKTYLTAVINRLLPSRCSASTVALLGQASASEPRRSGSSA